MLDKMAISAYILKVCKRLNLCKMSQIVEVFFCEDEILVNL